MFEEEEEDIEAGERAALLASQRRGVPRSADAGLYGYQLQAQREAVEYSEAEAVLAEQRQREIQRIERDMVIVSGARQADSTRHAALTVPAFRQT